MKLLQTLLLLLITTAIFAQKIRLQYEPQEPLIEFQFEGLTIYTDTTSLFAVYDNEGSLKDYDSMVKTFVRKCVNDSKSDTTVFSGEFIPIEEGPNIGKPKYWYTDVAIITLTNQAKLKIYDKHGHRVKSIVAKKRGKKKKNFVKRSYINRTTREELFFEVLFLKLVNPHF